MKAGTQITTARLILRHWRDEDMPALHRLNHDEQVMRFFPMRRTLEQTRDMAEIIRNRIAEDGFGWAAICLADDAQTIIGMGGYARSRMGQPYEPAVEIGWRLLPEYWGMGYASEAAQAYLAQGFEELGLSEIVSVAVWNNHASTAVMKRIGMTPEPALDFDHPNVPDTLPELKRHVFYRLTRIDWLKKKAAI